MKAGTVARRDASPGGGADLATVARAAALSRAQDYPYTLPVASYLWRGGAVEAFDSALTAGRTPVLAVGSNQSPDQLTRKFGTDPDRAIPVERVWLDGFDSVYAAHLAAYGAVPAMLQASPGTRIGLFVTWLSDDQLPVMHETELKFGNYHYACLDGVVAACETTGRLSGLHAYIGRRGHLLHEGAPLALAAVPAENRRFRDCDTATALAVVHARVGGTLPLEDFILAIVADAAHRTDCIGRLCADAVPFGHPYRVVA